MQRVKSDPLCHGTFSARGAEDDAVRAAGGVGPGAFDVGEWDGPCVNVEAACGDGGG
jgi:hypothetical protein